VPGEDYQYGVKKQSNYSEFDNQIIQDGQALGDELYDIKKTDDMVFHETPFLKRIESQHQLI
jgi:hypothetical protein